MRPALKIESAPITAASPAVQRKTVIRPRRRSFTARPSSHSSRISNASATVVRRRLPQAPAPIGQCGDTRGQHDGACTKVSGQTAPPAATDDRCRNTAFRVDQHDRTLSGGSRIRRNRPSKDLSQVPNRLSSKDCRNLLNPYQLINSAHQQYSGCLRNTDND